MVNKKVSIVLPTYNGADFIAQSIKSVLTQTYENWELIIVNDCSTDDTLSICESFAKNDSRICIISNERNLKIPRSLNIGFEKATGGYHTWTSDDNMYKPEAIETMVNALENNDGAVMVYSNLSDIDDKGEVIRQVEFRDSKYGLLENVWGACFLYTASVAQKVGLYDDNMFLAEDYDYWIRVMLVGKIIHLSDDLYFYRRHSKALTQTRLDSVNEQTYKVLLKNFLGLYSIAVRNNLVNEFFDHMLERGQAHYDETYELLVTVNKGYRRCLFKRKLKRKIRQVKQKLKRVIKK
jgi:glycosyltransferase involved in cell wall biosynthesis